MPPSLPHRSPEGLVLAPRLALRSTALPLGDGAGQHHRLGHQVAQAIRQRWTPRPVLVLCGPGRNGTHGMATACHLADAGWPVRVACLVQNAAAPTQAVHWHGPIEPLSPPVLQGTALVVDALWDSGLNQPLPEVAARTLSAAAAQHLPVVAIDLPSGVCPATGRAEGAVPCVLTVAGGRKTPGHVLQPGRRLCGELLVAHAKEAPAISPESSPAPTSPDTFENDPLLWADQLPVLQPEGHKYTRGHALVCGGWPATGAARLAALAAARMGAGLTTVAVPAVALPVYAAALTSIMVSPLAQPHDLQALLSDPRYTGLLIGPGAGLAATTRAHVQAMLGTGRATVLDADALSVFHDAPQTLFDAITGPCVLTPHDGEFARLFRHAVDLQADKLSRARAAARCCRAVVVLKGSDTVIAAPNGLAIVNTNAPPTLATAGAGDVLAGMVLGLLTQGMPPLLAAAAAVWLHGAAASRFGLGLIADDLPGVLPAVLQSLSLDPPHAA